MQKIYYVYGHYDEKGLLRYIGSGSRSRSKSYSQRPDHWKKVFKDKKPEVKLLAVFLNEGDAREEKHRLIKKHKDLGHDLINVLITTKGFAHLTKEEHAELAKRRSGEKHWSFGKQRSQVTKDKISETKKANPTRYWAGRKRSEEDPETMRKLWQAGHSPEARAKQAAAKRGKTLTEKHKAKISASNKGRVCSQETKDKISKAKKGRSNGLEGSKRSEAVKEKIRQDRLKDWQDPEYRKKMTGPRRKGWTTGRAKEVICLDTKKVYRCAREAAADCGTSDKCIQRVCKGHRKTTAGLRFAYTKAN